MNQSAASSVIVSAPKATRTASVYATIASPAARPATADVSQGCRSESCCRLSSVMLYTSVGRAPARKRRYIYSDRIRQLPLRVHYVHTLCRGHADRQPRRHHCKGSPRPARGRPGRRRGHEGHPEASGPVRDRHAADQLQRAQCREEIAGAARHAGFGFRYRARVRRGHAGAERPRRRACRLGRRGGLPGRRRAWRLGACGSVVRRGNADGRVRLPRIPAAASRGPAVAARGGRRTRRVHCWRSRRRTG